MDREQVRSTIAKYKSNISTLDEGGKRFLLTTSHNIIRAKIKGEGSIQISVILMTDGSITFDQTYELNMKDYISIDTSFEKHTDDEVAIIVIRNSENITELDVSNSGLSGFMITVEEIPLKLEKLFIHDNELIDLDIYAGVKNKLTTIQYIHMQNNPVCKDEAIMRELCEDLPDRNGKAFGSIVMYDFVPPRNFDTMTEEQKSIRELRRKLEELTIPKDWYFGSAIMYDEVERNKVSSHILTSNAVDIWESAEYGEGATYASLYEIYVPDKTAEWDKGVFLDKYDITQTGEVVKTTQTDTNASYDTGHGTATNAMLISQGIERYGLIPKAKCVPIMRGTSLGTVKYFSPKVFNKLTELEKLDFIFTSTISSTKAEYPEYAESIKRCLDKHKTLFFISSSNNGDDDISTEDPYVQTYHACMVSGCNLGIDVSNIMTYLSGSPSINDKRIKFTANYAYNDLFNGKSKTNAVSGTSYSTSFQAGVFCLLKILFQKKFPNYTLQELEQYTYNHAKPLHYNEDKVVGYGTLNCMYYHDVSKDVKAKSIAKREDVLDLQHDNKISSVISINPTETTNQDFRLADKLDDRDIIVDKGIIYPQKNDGSVVTKKLFSSSNLDLSQSIDIKLPKNKKYEEIKDGLIFSLSGVDKEFVNSVTGEKLVKNGTVTSDGKKIKFESDGALILNGFKMPKKEITIQFLADKETSLPLDTIEYPLYFYNSKNDKYKILCILRKFTLQDQPTFAQMYQLGSSEGNIVPNHGNKIMDEYNEPFNVHTISINFDKGTVSYYRNGISINALQLSDVKSYITSTSAQKSCYIENLRKLKDIDTLIIGNNKSMEKGSVYSELYDIRVFNRELTPTEVVQNTSALMCNAQIKEEEENMAIEAKDILVAIKAFSRANSLPLDASSVHGSQEIAATYAKQANAYGGQIITAKVDGKFKPFILQGENGNCTIEPLGADPSTLKQYVVIGTRPESGQQEGVIYIDGDVGYIWTGSKWKKIFEDVSVSITDFEERIGKLEVDITTKANIANPEFTGSVKLDGKDLATKEYADSVVAAARKEVPTLIDTDNPFPEKAYKAGQKYVVGVAGTYLGQKCEVGDVILITKDYIEGTASNSDGLVLQANIDGAVTGADSSIDGEIIVFNGATGKVIKSSKINMTALSDAIAKAHEHANKDKLDTYDKTQTELLESASADAQSKVDALKTTVDGKADKATTLAGYGIEDAYNKTEVDAKLKTIEDNVNTKVDAATVDSKIESAKEEITNQYNTAIDEKIEVKVGDLGESDTVVDFVQKVVGSGGADIAEQIDEAIRQAKEYTDSCLTIVEF